MVKLVSNHGKIRIRERLGNVRGNSILRLVLDNGNTKYDYKGDFFLYLVSKEQQKHSKVKVYQNNIYILSKNTKRLVTTYPIPQKYFPTDQFELTALEKKILNFIFRNSDYAIKFKLIDDEVEGFVSFIKYKPLDIIRIKKDDKEIFIKINSIQVMISPIEFFEI